MVEKRRAVKTLRGRGRQRHDWVEYLHQILLSEFERLCSSDVQLSRSLMKYATVALLEEENSAYSSCDVDPTTSRQISEHVTMKWVDSFLNLFNLLIR